MLPYSWFSTMHKFRKPEYRSLPNFTVNKAVCWELIVQSGILYVAWRNSIARLNDFDTLIWRIACCCFLHRDWTREVEYSWLCLYAWVWNFFGFYLVLMAVPSSVSPVLTHLLSKSRSDISIGERIRIICDEIRKNCLVDFGCWDVGQSLHFWVINIWLLLEGVCMWSLLYGLDQTRLKWQVEEPPDSPFRCCSCAILLIWKHGFN
jgi:hypothetical protein